jgi:acyl carrier protein
VSDHDQIATRVRELVTQVLGVPSTSIGPEFAAGSTPSWTSLNHLMLISQVESAFGVFFTNQEIRDLTTFDQIVKAVGLHLDAGA